MSPIKEAIEALEGLDEAYCRAGAPLTKDERTEDRKRLIKARAALAALRSMPAETVGEKQAVLDGLYAAWNREPAGDTLAAIGNAIQHLQATPPPPPAPVLSDAEIRQWWSSENGLEDMDMCKIDDFTTVVRAIEQAIGRASRGAK